MGVSKLCLVRYHKPKGNPYLVQGMETELPGNI